EIISLNERVPSQKIISSADEMDSPCSKSEKPAMVFSARILPVSTLPDTILFWDDFSNRCFTTVNSISLPAIITFAGEESFSFFSVLILIILEKAEAEPRKKIAACRKKLYSHAGLCRKCFFTKMLIAL